MKDNNKIVLNTLWNATAFVQDHLLASLNLGILLSQCISYYVSADMDIITISLNYITVDAGKV